MLRGGPLALLLLVCGCPESIRVVGDDGGIPGGGDGCMTDYRSRVSVPAPTGDARLYGVTGIAFDGERNLYVLNRETPVSQSHVTVLSPAPEHRLIRSFGRGDLGVVRDLAVASDGTTYVVDWDDQNGTPTIFRYSPEGVLEDRFETTEPDMANDMALSVALDDENILYVGGRVLFRYRTDGTYVDDFGEEGPNPGQVLLPLGLAWDPRGYLWIADLFRNTIHQFDLSTRAQALEFGGRGTELGMFDGGAEDGVFWGPTKVALDTAGNLYATDPWSSRLQKLDRAGGSLGSFPFGGSRELDGALAIEPSNHHLYLARGNTIDIVCPF